MLKKGLIIAILLYCYTCLAGRRVAILLAFPSFTQEKPKLTIVSPQEGETIFGNKVVFSFFVSNFILNVNGYLRLSLDQKEPFIIKEQKDFSFTNLSGGKHALVAELVDKKNQSLSPVIKKEVAFSSVLPKAEKGVNLEISPAETKETDIFLPLSLGLLGSSGAILAVLAFKFYINSKTSQDRSHQKPLG